MVVGPSGGGKDALLGEARRRLAGDTRIAFADRFITRPVSAGPGEVHIEVSQQEFQRACLEDCFGLSWSAHGTGYGIAKEKFELLEQGTSLVANVSRSVVEEARENYPPTLIVVVTASHTTLRARLEARGRESSDEVERRLLRARSFELCGDDVVELVNEGALLSNAERFTELLV